MNKLAMSFAAFYGATGVIFGAFGAHILKQNLSIEQLSSFDTGTKYQLIHALVLLVLAFNQDKLSKKLYFPIVLLMSIGILFFSFSIYLLSTKSITGIENIGFLGPITPIGGSLIIFSWILLFISSFKNN